MTDLSHRTGRRKYLVAGALCITIVLFLLAIAPWLISRWIGEHADWSSRGAFSEQFGLPNALFAGLAFAGVIIAILLQSDELSLQREELHQTRNVFVEQKQQMQAQDSALQKQSFESTFFQMLSLHHQIVESITIRGHSSGIPQIPSEPEAVGRDALWRFANSATSRISKCIDRKNASRQNILTAINDAYLAVYRQKLSNSLGHYFRNLYQIVRFVDDSGIDNKKTYTRIIRAQLSEAELVLLFYNCMSEIGKKFLPLAERYDLFDNLDPQRLAHVDDRALTTSKMDGQ